jgi:hypothetical protein
MSGPGSGITCQMMERDLPLFLYGELSFDQEEQVHQHLAGCEACQNALVELQSLHAALDQQDVTVPDGLLVAARRSLRQSISVEAERAAEPSFWQRLLAWPAWKPAGAVAAVAMAFFGGRMTNVQLAGLEPSSAEAAPMVSRVRYVEPNQAGGVQIVLDETRQRVVSGNMEDQAIRQLLLAAAKDPSDPGLRVESVEMLSSRSQEAEIRNALLAVLEHDANPGVRLKALEGLKAFAKDQPTRQVLSRVLLKDTNSGVRSAAIDVLTSVNSQDTVGTLQELMRREDNDYVRLRTRKALSEMKASPGIF